MKRTSIIFILMILILQSCSREEDDFFSINCETNCTEFFGKVMTDNGTTPISNLSLTVKWDNIQYLGSGVVRVKDRTTSDSDGNFRLNFFVRDDEISSGSFTIEYEIDENKYYSSHLNKMTEFRIEKRDTTLNLNYNIPKKSYLYLNLQNLDKVEKSDYFSTTFSYEKPLSFKQSINGHAISWNNDSKQNNLIELVGNQKVLLKIIRRKNNVYETETDTLFIEAGRTLNYTIDYIN